MHRAARPGCAPEPSHAGRLRAIPHITKLILNAYARGCLARGASAADDETAKALLERLARTQGLDLSASWWKTRWKAAAVVAIAACGGAAAWRFIAAQQFTGSLWRATPPEQASSLEHVVTLSTSTRPSTETGADVPSRAAIGSPPITSVTNVPAHAIESSGVGADAADTAAADSPSALPEPPQPPARSAIVSPTIETATNIASATIESSSTPSTLSEPPRPPARSETVSSPITTKNISSVTLESSAAPSTLPERSQPHARSATVSHPVRSATPSVDANEDIDAGRVEIPDTDHDTAAAKLSRSTNPTRHRRARLAISEFGVGRGSATVSSSAAPIASRKALSSGSGHASSKDAGRRHDPASGSTRAV